jgi:4-coumarate--CoA ligase
MFYNLLFQLYCGSSVVVVSKFSFTGMLQSIVKYKINNLFIVPPIAIMLCQRPETMKFDLSSLRTILSSASPLSLERFKQLSALLPQAAILQGYGSTEAGIIGMETNGEKTGISAGILVPGIVARVQRADGTYAGFNEPGELIIKTHSMASGYSNNEEAFKETFVDGWMRTGDEVTINENLEIFVVDRVKEMLKVRGFQVAPTEMEAHLAEHPFVSEACVVGIPHEFHGELPFALIIPEKKTAALIAKYPEEEAKLKNLLAKHVADHKIAYKAISGGIEFVDSIPKAGAGKLLRRVARENAKKLLAERVKQISAAKPVTA